MIAHTIPVLAVTAALGVGAVPMPAPQGVTALITPGTVLDGCIISYPGVHGISIQGIVSAAAASSAVAAGGPAAAAGGGVVGGAGSAASAAAAGGPGEKLRRQAVPQIPDGQIQVIPTLEPRAPEIPAGVIHTLGTAAGAVTQIADGQIQAHPAVGSAVGDASGPVCPAPAIEVVTQIADGQIQAPGLVCSGAAVTSAAGPAVGKSASTSAPAAAGSATTGATAAGAATQIAGRHVRAPQKRSILKARQNGDPLGVTLKGGVLTDILGRIGYIADNRQLQFDAPPQAGAIYTAGFSACPDGTLALGDKNIFYACGSSDFTNLYDTLVYPDNCREVKLFLI